MTLTKIKTGGIQDDAVTSAKIPADAVGTSELADNSVANSNLIDSAVSTAKIADDAVTDAKLANSINSAIAANTAKASIIINNNAGGRVITGSGTANNLNAQSNVHVDGSGRLLVGTTTEGFDGADNLTIEDSGHCGITIRSGATSDAQISFSDATSGSGEYAGQIVYDHTDNFMMFRVNGGSEAMRINTNGNVGIGEIAPADNRIRSTSSHTYNIVAKSTNGNGGYHNFTGVNSSSAITSYITHNGRVGASDGIIFGSDTAAANVLDDYEEGTWTPTFNNAGGFNTNNTVAKYTKIGRVVHWVCQVAVQRNGSSSSGTFTIGGLPFTALNQATGGHGYAGCMGALYKWDIPSNAYQIGIRVPDNTTFIQFFANFDNAADAQLTSPFPANQTIFGSLSGTYIT